MTDSRTYDWNGHTDIPIMMPDKSDIEIASMVRMLMRNQLDHEAVCCAARDRIMALVKEVARKDAALALAERHISAGVPDGSEPLVSIRLILHGDKPKKAGCDTYAPDVMVMGDCTNCGWGPGDHD